MAPITWRNVDAPNFRDAIAGTAQSAALLSRGFDGLGDVAKDIRAQQKQTASQAAIAQALGITDAGQYQERLANGGIASFGANPNDLTKDALDFFANRAGDLLQDESKQTSIDNTRLNMSLAQARDARVGEAHDLQYQRNLLDFEGDKLSYGDRLKTRELATQGRSIADEVAKLPLSQEEGRMAIVSQQLPPDLEAAALDAFGSLDGSHWEVAPENMLLNNPQVSGNYRAAMDTLAQRDAERNFATGGNELLQLYEEGSRTFSDYDSPLTGLIDTLKNPSASEAEAQNWSGTLTNTFNDLKKRTGLSDEIVATVMRNNLRGTNLLDLSLGKVQIDKAEIERQLNYVASDENRKGLATSLAAVKRDRAEAARLTQELDKERSRYNLASQRGNEEAAQRALAAIDRIMEQAGTLARTDVPGKPTTNVALPGQSGGSTNISAEDLLNGLVPFAAKGQRLYGQ